jgi:hypothetical protein
MRLQFQKGATAADLIWDAPEGQSDGSATLTIYRGASIWRAAAPVVRDATSATLTAQADVGTDTLTVDDTTGFELDRRYTLILPNGKQYDVTVRGLTATVLYLDSPVLEDIPSASTVVSPRFETALTTAELSSVERRLRAEWVYDYRGRQKAHPQYFDVVGLPWVLDVTERDLSTQDASISQHLTRLQRWRDVIVGGANEVERVIWQADRYPDLFRDRDLLKQSVVKWTLAKLYRGMKDEGFQKIADGWEAKGKAAVSAILQSRAWYDGDDDLFLDGNQDDSLSAFDPESGAGYRGSATGIGVSELRPPAKYMGVG